MGSKMAFDKVSTTSTKWATAFALVAAVASNASAQNQVELTCHTTPEAIAAVQQKITKDLGMMATTSHFTNVGTDQNPKWAMATLMRNPETKKGYEWARMPAGHVCISKSYSNVDIYPNTKLDARAFLDPKKAPRANDVGNKTDLATVGINGVLLVKEKEQQFPMYRATVDDIINIKKDPLKTPTKYIEYLVGNPTSKEGTIIAANFNGSSIREYYNVVGTPQANGVKFGAIYTPAAEQMLGITSSVAALALNK
jgi:hypothetical protein